MDKIESVLHSPSLPEMDKPFVEAVVSAAIDKNSIRFRTAPNGSVWPCDSSGKIYLGLV